MKHFAFVLIVFTFVTINCTNGWVLTDINYDQLARTAGDIDDQLTEDELKQLKFNLIYPGTKWCGSGNIADDYDDLGSAADTDKCCRAHDLCPDIISAGETQHNLTNTAFYTRLSCQCDEDFRQCLHEANSSTSKQIGTVYFNVLGTKCYREDYPVTGCAKKAGLFNRKCLEYQYDTNGNKTHQWFDVPYY
ncbi:phospholipase A2-like [Aphomia sociella]